MAAAHAFEAGRAAFSPSVTGDFLNNRGMQGSDNHWDPVEHFATVMLFPDLLQQKQRSPA